MRQQYDITQGIFKLY